MKVKELLTNKQDIVTTSESVTMLAAIKIMCDARVGALLVVNEKGDTVGIITERDVLRFCANRSTELDKTAISEIMTKDMCVATQETPIDDIMGIMTEKKFRHMPVVETDGQVIGMLSIGDLVKAKLEQTAVEAKYLRDYINS